MPRNGGIRDHMTTNAILITLAEACGLFAISIRTGRRLVRESKVDIEARGGRTFGGWRSGTDTEPAPAKRIDNGPLFDDPANV